MRSSLTSLPLILWCERARVCVCVASVVLPSGRPLVCLFFSVALPSRLQLPLPLHPLHPCLLLFCEAFVREHHVTTRALSSASSRDGFVKRAAGSGALTKTQ